MTRDEIIAMAKDSDLDVPCDWENDFYDRVERFAALVAAAEREACAKVCEEYDNRLEQMRDNEYQAELSGRQVGAARCAAAIRSRG